MDKNSRSAILFTAISHALVHTYELSIPILVIIWLDKFPVSTATLGTVVSIGYGLFGIGALPGGILADHLGSRILILSCLVGMGISFVFLSFATGIMSIGIALAMWGIAASVYHPSGLSLISTSIENQGSAFAYHGMAGNIGIALGPLVTALLLLKFDWRIVTRVFFIPTAIAIVYGLNTEFDERAAVRINESSEQTNSIDFSGFIRDSRSLFTIGFALAMAIVTMNGLFYRGMLTFLPNILDSFLPPISNYIQLFEPESPLAKEFTLSSYVYVGLLTAGIAGQYTAGKFLDEISPETGLAVVFGSLSIITVSFIPAAEIGLIIILLVSGLLGFFLFALQPLYQATIAEHSPPDDRGLSYGYTYFTSFGIGATGAAIVGYLLTIAGVKWTFIMFAVFPIAGGLLAAILKQINRS